MLWKFLVLTTFRTLGKNSLDLWRKFFDKVFNTALYVSGGPISAERKCSANSFQIHFLKHCAKFFSNFHKVIMHGCRIFSSCDRSIVFRKFFLKTNFFSTFIGFGRNIPKLLVKNFHHVCQNRNLRPSGNFLEEKLLILTAWILHEFFRLLGESVLNFCWKNLHRVVKTTF